MGGKWGEDVDDEDEKKNHEEEKVGEKQGVK